MLKIKSLITKIILSCLVFILLTFSFVPYVHAEEGGSWYNQSFPEWYSKVYDSSNPSEIFGERYTAAQVEWIFYSLFAFVINKTTDPETTSCLMLGNIKDCIDRLKQFFSFAPSRPKDNKSLVELLFLEERPISGIGYFRQKARDLNLIPEARAQGFGFTQGLGPVLTMWKASRNIAYALLVIAIVVLAFMIMFRVKISPQVVITAQSAIPKVVLALILITFSYAIAGFLIDLMYVAIGLVSLLGSQFFPFEVSSGTIYNFLTKGQPFNIDAQAGIFLLFIIYLFAFALGFLITVIVFFGAIQTIMTSAVLGAFGGAIASTGIGGLILMLGLFFILILLLWYFFKTVWTLLKAFAQVLLLTIFAPLQILLGLLVPGFGFTSWLKSYVSNLSVFVTAGALFLLSYVFLIQGVALALEDLAESGLGVGILNLFFGTFKVSAIPAAFRAGSSSAWPPLLGVGSYGVPLLFLGVSFVLFIIIPQTADIIKSVIERKPFAFGALEATKTAWGLTGAPIVGGIREYSALSRGYDILGGLEERFPGSESIRKARQAMGSKLHTEERKPEGV